MVAFAFLDDLIYTPPQGRRLHRERGHVGAIYLRYPQACLTDPFGFPETVDAPALLPDCSTHAPRSRAEARFLALLPCFLL